jgi:hypothetical protein
MWGGQQRSQRPQRRLRLPRPARPARAGRHPGPCGAFPPRTTTARPPARPPDYGRQEKGGRGGGGSLLALSGNTCELGAAGRLPSRRQPPFSRFAAAAAAAGAAGAQGSQGGPGEGRPGWRSRASGEHRASGCARLAGPSRVQCPPLKRRRGRASPRLVGSMPPHSGSSRCGALGAARGWLVQIICCKFT